jgi:hypothetical protein
MKIQSLDEADTNDLLLKTYIKSLMQVKWHLYGVCGNMVKLGHLNAERTFVLEAVEGATEYEESMLQDIKTYEDDPPDATFSKEPVATVSIVEDRDEKFGGWKFIDDQEHVWLSLGTSIIDDPQKAWLPEEKHAELPIYHKLHVGWTPKPAPPAPTAPPPDPKFDPFDL